MTSTGERRGIATVAAAALMVVSISSANAAHGPVPNWDDTTGTAAQDGPAEQSVLLERAPAAEDRITVAGARKRTKRPRVTAKPKRFKKRTTRTTQGVVLRRTPAAQAPNQVGAQPDPGATGKAVIFNPGWGCRTCGYVNGPDREGTLTNVGDDVTGIVLSDGTVLRIRQVRP